MKKKLQIEAQIESFEQLVRIRKHTDHLLKQCLTKSGLSVLEWEILLYVTQNEQTSASELASAFGVTRSLISRTIWQLIKLDLIQSQINYEDRRNKTLSLTDNGQNKVQDTEKQVCCNIQKLLKNNDFATLINQVFILTKKIDKIDF